MEQLKKDTIVHLAGWGYDKYYDGEYTEELHSVQLPIVSNDQCQEWMGSRINLKDSHLCAGYEEGKKDGCTVIFAQHSESLSRNLLAPKNYSVF